MKNRNTKQSVLSIAITAAFSCTSVPLYAAGVNYEIDEVLVTADADQDELLGKAEAASIGTVTAEQIEHRPILRPAEILETVPGMVVTQHSGGGKANQYFLRGFNLDHSTDFANYFEGAPVNMVSHGHGQGYSDFNFLIPELVDRMVYKKGPYYADGGNFSSAGSAEVFYARRLDENRIKVSIGEDGYRRALVYGGVEQNDSNIVYAVSRTMDDGPWTKPDDLKRDNAFVKYTHGDSQAGYSVSAMYFDSRWQGTDQIPRRLVEEGQLSRFDTLDDQTGGDTNRHQLSYAVWSELNASTRFKANAYLVDYALALTSNFTYFSKDVPQESPVEGVAPEDISDEFTQVDDRIMTGGDVIFEVQLDNHHRLDLGSDLRFDRNRDVGIGSSFQREIYAYDSRAKVEEVALGLFSSVYSEWNDSFATIVGLRFDYINVDVEDKLDSADSGSDNQTLLSPKVSLRFGPFNETQFFINYGKGFHSNDGRGAVKGDAPLISESEGYEVGISSWLFDSLQLSAVAFQLDLDSELVFVGDDGTTEPKAASRRQGVEVSAFYQPLDWLIIDSDYTYADAKFRETQFDGDTELGDSVPDSIEDVFSLGASADFFNGVYAGLRLRYFGPRNLNESGTVKSSSSQMVNANLGYQAPSGWEIGLEVLNLTDRDDDDITYFYESRTKEERQRGDAPQEDFHFHTMVPRTLRLHLAYPF